MTKNILIKTISGNNENLNNNSNNSRNSNNNSNKSNNNQLCDEIILSNASQILNQFGRFQIRSILLLIPMFLGLGMYNLSSVFYLTIPDYQCQLKEGNASMDYEVQNVDGVTQVNEYVQLHNRQCTRFKVATESEQNSTSRIRTEENCQNGRSFNTTNGNTLVSTFDLVCDSAWKRPLIISIRYLGMMIGGMFGGQLSDKFGRRFAGLLGLSSLAFFTIIATFSFDYWFFFGSLFFSGISSAMAYYCTFTWVQEMVNSAEKRASTASAINGIHASGGMLLSLVAYSLPNWDWMYRVVGLTFVISIPLMWLVPESPKWIMQSGNTVKAANLLKRISKINRTPINRNVSEFNKLKEENCKRKLETGLLWQNVVFRRRLILICILWNVVFLSYITLSLNSANLGGSSYINNLVGSFVDVVAAVSITGVMKKFGRKYTLAFALGSVGFSCFVSPRIKEANHAAGIGFAMAGRLFTTSSMYIVILYTGEMFPTLLRNTSVVLASMSSRLSSLCAPFLIFAGEEIDLSIPFYVMGGLATLAVYLTLLLPETSKSLLPNTIEEALALQDPRLIPRRRKHFRVTSETVEVKKTSSTKTVSSCDHDV